MSLNIKAFFDQLRSSPLGPTLSQDEVDGVNAILLAFTGAPTCWVAYALATAYHETAGTMQPIKERGSMSYFTRLYDVSGKNPERATKMGNTAVGDGPKYCGRGYVQLTWKRNYKLLGDKIGVNLILKPDDAMNPAVAAAIMDVGMTQGLFTGVSLSECFPADHGSRREFEQARKIINGTDRAEDIANYAMSFQNCLNAAQYISTKA